MDPTARDLEPLWTPVRRAERRLRVVRAFRVLPRAVAVAAAGALTVLVLRKTGLLAEPISRATLLALSAGVVVSAVIAYALRLPPMAGAVALDRYHRLADRLSSALAFTNAAGYQGHGGHTTHEPSPFMQAAVDDALLHVAGLNPKAAVPFRVPRHAGIALVLAISCAVVALFEVRTRQTITAAKTIDPVDVTADDIDALREFLLTQSQREHSAETQAAIDQFNQLVQDLAAKRLDRTEAFRRMQALEEKLLEGREADAKALEDALAKIGDQLKKAELTKPLGDALDNKNLVDAEKQLRELAKKLREQGNKIDKRELDKMREALKQAASDHTRREQAIRQKRDELQKQLLEQRRKMGDAGANEQEKSLLDRRQRELERLDRDLSQQESAGRQLDRLDRELSQAAEDLMRDMGLSAEDLERGAEDINRMGREQMTQEEKEQLRQKLQDLREMLRQQGQGGQGQMSRLRRFQQKARGQGGQGGQSGQGQEGQEGQEGQQGQEGQEGEGQEGQGQNGQRGQGQGEQWVLGPHGERMLLIGKGRSQSGQGQGQGQRPGPGAGKDPGGPVQGQATNPTMGTQDTQVAGQDTGQGQSRSEVIYGAAERGFASRGYQKVFREYHTVAEEALNKDEIPGGYRFYVRRYFELIRPRDQDKPESAAPTPPTPDAQR